MNEESKPWYSWIKIDLSGIISTILILGMLWASWVRFSNDIEVLKANQKQQSEVLEKLSVTLDKLNGTLQTFPLHLHLSNGDILYPDGKETPDHVDVKGH